MLTSRAVELQTVCLLTYQCVPMLTIDLTLGTRSANILGYGLYTHSMKHQYNVAGELMR